ncbi:MAG TPA: family 1 encapsulin nanocompartment shell protein [Polyangiaceae bacterium]|jgi:uncharacterized linocin/CFP29 family protein|nr:family 1 encapsulin nanocompartment shell protein [Polyangiaceae bacterium]
MHSDLVERGWTEEHWNRITSAVTEEAQKARVAAQMLPLVGPEDPTTIAVPDFRVGAAANPNPPPPQRLIVNSSPNLFLTTIAATVQLRSHEMADPSLKAALGMFRRAAANIARVEDCLMFNGGPAAAMPAAVPPPVASVTTVSSDGAVALDGLIVLPPPPPPPPPPYTSRLYQKVAAPLAGDDVVNAIVAAIGLLDGSGHQAPYAVALGQDFFNEICRPVPGSLVMPRDRILPFLQGPLLRASALPPKSGVVVSLSANPVELVVGSDLSVRFLQSTPEPRYIFRVCERVALRIRELEAICVLHT